jgi:hypothetical protein
MGGFDWLVGDIKKWKEDNLAELVVPTSDGLVDWWVAESDILQSRRLFTDIVPWGGCIGVRANSLQMLNSYN